MKTKFSKLNTLCDCRICGKKTHSSIDGDLDIQLCRKCYTEAGLENEHADGLHSGIVKKNCPQCKGWKMT